MKVILASGQSAGVVFDGPPTVDDIKRLIAALELQRSFIAGDPINLDVKFSSDVAKADAGASGRHVGADGKLHGPDCKCDLCAIERADDMTLRTD